MPMMGLKEINGKNRKVVFCSRDKNCEFWSLGANEVREHENLVHPREESESDLTKINPLFRKNL